MHCKDTVENHTLYVLGYKNLMCNDSKSPLQVDFLLSLLQLKSVFYPKVMVGHVNPTIGSTFMHTTVIDEMHFIFYFRNMIILNYKA